MDAPPLELLETFAAVVRAGNLTRAAEARHLTVSALSHRIRQLEQRLGERLLIRGPRGVVPTRAGQVLYDALVPAFESIERALRGLRARSQDGLTVSLMPSMASAWLIPRLPRFLARHPQIGISLVSTSELVDFSRAEVDCALRFGPGGWPGVEAELLFDEWVMPVASPALLARIGRPKLADLGSAPLLGDPAGRWRDWFARFGGTMPQQFVARFDDSESLHHAAVQGLGIALGRATMARPLIEAGRLKELTGQRLKAEWSHYLVYPERSRALPAFEALRAWLREEAAAYAAASRPPRTTGAASSRKATTPAPQARARKRGRSIPSG